MRTASTPLPCPSVRLSVAALTGVLSSLLHPPTVPRGPRDQCGACGRERTAAVAPPGTKLQVSVIPPSWEAPAPPTGWEGVVCAPSLKHGALSQLRKPDPSRVAMDKEGQRDWPRQDGELRSCTDPGPGKDAGGKAGAIRVQVRVRVRAACGAPRAEQSPGREVDASRGLPTLHRCPTTARVQMVGAAGFTPPGGETDSRLRG